MSSSKFYTVKFCHVHLSFKRRNNDKIFAANIEGYVYDAIILNIRTLTKLSVW